MIAPTSDNSILSPTATDPAAANHAAQARKVAKDFESLFASFMVRAMRKTVGENSLVPASTGEKIYTGMLDDEYAKLIAGNGRLGLAEMILRQIEKSEGSDLSGLDELKNLRTQPWMIDQRFAPTGRQSIGNFEGLRKGVDQWGSYIDDAAARYGVDRNLVAAVVAQESAGDPLAHSPAGAKGLMQIIDSTARDLGLTDSFNPRENVDSGVRYLRQMLDRFNNNEHLALASYNAGPGAVDQYGGIPPFAETRNYVQRVLELRQRFASAPRTQLTEVNNGTAE
jgi:soluble lytic murein transglycosylase-like protein